MPTPLTARDPVAEKDFLASVRHLDWLLLQRDWQNPRHGDLDILLCAGHWPQFIDQIVDFCADNDRLLAKAYEIEDRVVCAILMTATGRVHLDVALSRPRPRFFGVDTERALRRRDLSQQFPIAHAEDALTYATNKAKYKKSTVRILTRKIRNIPVILRRIINGTIIVSGGLLYIPFMSDSEILSCRVIRMRNEVYLKGTLRKRYLSRRNDI
jgi:hypothetical protein